MQIDRDGMRARRKRAKQQEQQEQQSSTGAAASEALRPEPTQPSGAAGDGEEAKMGGARRGCPQETERR